MKKTFITIITLILVIGTIIQNIPKNKMPITTKIEFSKQINAFNVDKISLKDDSIGYIYIHKINLKEKLYSINNKKNKVNQNVSILKDSTFPNKKESTMIIAAHSGEGHLAYFKNLNKLEIGDLIKLKLYNRIYTYKVQDKWEEKKTGSIRFPIIDKKQLILTTCSTNKDNYQLIVNCILKE